MRHCYPGIPLILVCSSARAEEAAPQRNGVWLQSGIELYRRMGGQEGLSENEAGRALIAVTYVCAVVDLEKFLVFRAGLLKEAVAAARRRSQMQPQELKGMDEMLPLLVPLMDTRFFADNPTCEQVLQIVWGYLGEYPELLPDDADVIIERALLDAYSQPRER